jgi:DNA-binding transcriptional ArsR family regulator
MSDKPERSVVRLDSEKLRALAHPLRLRIVGALRLHGPATATALADRLGSNSGKTSYHLRQLAAAGLVVEDEERGNARDRWWRAAHWGTSWSSTDFRDDPDDDAADTFLTGQVAALHARWTDDWLARRDSWPVEWIDASDLSDDIVRLTPQRAKQLGRDLHAVLKQYRDTEDDDDSPDAERVTVIMHSFPNPEPSL